MKNKQRIEALEKRVQALEGNIATSGYCQHAQGVNNPSYTIESSRNPIVEGGEITSIKATSTIKPTYPIESDLALEEVKQQVTELLRNADLPDWAEWVWVDDDGETSLATEKPTLDIGYWVSKNYNYLSYVALNGADWKQCCWKISDLLNDSDVKKNFTTEDSVSEKLQDDTQPDWENVLSVDDLENACRHDGTWRLQVMYLNKLIHQRIKPLLERIKELLYDNMGLDDTVEHFSTELEKANKVIAELKATFNDRLLDATRNAVEELKEAHNSITELEAENKKLDEALGEAQWSSNDFEAQLMKANEQIQFLKYQIEKIALHAYKGYDEGFNEGRLHREFNTIEVPFELDEDGDVEFDGGWISFSIHCQQNNIDQTKIKRIILEMKSEVEE